MSNRPISNKDAAWKALHDHSAAMEAIHMCDLFAQDDQRFDKFSICYDGLLADFSKHPVTDETMGLLANLAKSCDVEGWRRKMFSGEPVNVTEGRAALHTALRRPAQDEVVVDGRNIMPGIHAMLGKMEDLSNKVRSGAWTGHSGKAIHTVVNMGIGGSDLGPRTICEALGTNGVDVLTVRFVSNIDPACISDTLAKCDPERTLFVVASKSFTTQETMANAQTARQWLVNRIKDEAAIQKHFIAVSANENKVSEFGINPENMLGFDDWVGGRFSLWSPIGLSISLAHGFDVFRALLDGAYAMDRHFCEAPLQQNIPVILALLGLWHRNFRNTQAHAILPYSQRLFWLPAYLQQLEMESNGKNISRDGDAVSTKTSPVIFGQPGTDGQHAFFQLLHQGTEIIPCDFIGIMENTAKMAGEQHEMLLANMLAQSQALMLGRGGEEPNGRPPGNLHRVFAGNRPGTTILLPRLDPYYLGMLLALYEHKVFVQGIIWNINSFDQWGVELGKELANDILVNNMKNQDSSTSGLLEHIRKHTKLFL